MPQAGLPWPKPGNVYPAKVIVELPPVYGLIMNLNKFHITPIECLRLRHNLRLEDVEGKNISLLEHYAHGDLGETLLHNFYWSSLSSITQIRGQTMKVPLLYVWTK